MFVASVVFVTPSHARRAACRSSPHSLPVPRQGLPTSLTRLRACSPPSPPSPSSANKLPTAAELLTEVALSFDAVRLVSVTSSGAAVVESTLPLLAEGAHVREYREFTDEASVGAAATAMGREGTNNHNKDILTISTPDRTHEVFLDGRRLRAVLFVRERRAARRPHAGSHDGNHHAYVYSIRWLDENDALVIAMIVSAPTSPSDGAEERKRHRRAIEVWQAMRDKYGERLHLAHDA
ncbi:hypothetical protein CDCA_CDCA13G3710 [Cyanidium caldarium]|uniref:Uncharacterized protein n=1 Tax=Cyanidium caldarium TaxID=2771 RepID=A0AAV9IZY3_CYACA|nr:hypothetical protein CDCA_CDCA13G3710 [Cyanidium caldarium]